MSKFIEDWQREHGLVDDGIIGKDTIIAMHNYLCIPSLEATCHFLGNTYNETGGFTVFEENLNYSAQGLANTWPTRYKGKDGKPNDLAYELQRRPQAIANNAYANRMGNGDETSGDGWQFRGRGILQTTGKENYRQLSEYLGVDVVANPDLVANKYAMESAIFFFEKNKLWPICQSSVDDATIEKLRKRTNGGLIGISEVKKLTYKFWDMVKDNS